MPIRTLAFGLALSVVIAVSGCGGGESDSGSGGEVDAETTAVVGHEVAELVPADVPSGMRPAATQDVADREFRLIAAKDAPIPPGIDPRLDFEGSAIEASVSCNPVDGRYEIRNGVLKTKKFGAYPGGCEPERMAAEEWVVDLLKKPIEIRIKGDQLLLGPGDGVALFQDVSPNERKLEEFVWFNGTTKFLFSDGEYTVLAPCGNGSANVDVGEDTIEFAEMSFLQPCGSDHPEDAEAQSFLPGEMDYRLEGRELTLTNDDGEWVFEGLYPSEIGAE